MDRGFRTREKLAELISDRETANEIAIGLGYQNVDTLLYRSKRKDFKSLEQALLTPKSCQDIVPNEVAIEFFKNARTLDEVRAFQDAHWRKPADRMVKLPQKFVEYNASLDARNIDAESRGVLLAYQACPMSVRDSTNRRLYGAIGRCHDKSDKQYEAYGGRGITVCDRWRFGEGSLTPIECFVLDMGPAILGWQLDRINNDEGYCKENCRWVPPGINTANRIRKEDIAEMLNALVQRYIELNCTCCRVVSDEDLF